MNSQSLILSFMCVLILAAQGCAGNSQSQSEGPEVVNLAGTMVALTFQAATASTSQNMNIATLVHPVTPTTQPALFINNTVSCRSGTNTNFRVVTTFSIGMTVDIIGKNTAASAWLVKVPNSDESCWVLALDASPGGSYADLPEVTPHPSTQKPPSIPGSVSWPFICSYAHDVVYEVKVNLSWLDLGHNANGFHVYRYDVQIADLHSTTTSYMDTTDVAIGTQLKYSVEAYNDVGVSPRKTITINSICKK